ncbi:MAG TPA: DUF1800 domain-containing protein [Pyrinomonadaceae bacterium]|nr:DUF1800 domain-containing protein [Pyrinomonadaceae bacterium]HMP66898.1 DUF1800 domain-containing protein [Pyrinomonadaceae bacterium]
MFSYRTRVLGSFFGSILLSLFLVVAGFAQADPDPNSPVPILLSLDDSTRALADYPGGVSRTTRRTLSDTSFPRNSKINLYVTNIDLMDGEGANAFRVYIEDSAGRSYRFPVVALEPAPRMKDVYAATVLLRDELGFWDTPPAEGDVLVRLTWRGLSSNRVLLGIGKTGGNLKNDPGSFPTPLKVAESMRGMTASASVDTNELIGYRWSGDRMRFLQQAAFGPTAALDHRIRRIGIRTWLAEQFSAPYPSFNNPYPDIPLKSTDSNNVTLGCGMFPDNTPERRACNRDHYSMYPVQNWFMKEALYGDPQLRHRVAWALSQVWVISGAGGVTQQSSWMLAYHKILSQHAFGNYRDIMRDITLNPGMGNYLDMARSTRNNPNENYPREILQLFTIGLFMMNQDGTLILDGQGNPIPTYDQGDVDEFTKVFTGWSFCNQTCPNSAPGIVNYKDPMILNQNNHNIQAKTLLDYPNAPHVNIPANLNGNDELERALDNIFYHPNVAPFVSKLMIQHLVTSDPTPAYVGRVAAAFNDNGYGVRGDMRAVVRAILLDPEARGDVKTDPFFGKLREPVQLVTNVLRAFNVKSANLQGQSDGVLTNYTNPLGQNPFNSPTVFNYYPSDYVIPGTSMPGPEFGLMTTGTAIGRANFGNSVVYSTLSVVETRPTGTAIDISDCEALAAEDTTGNRLLDDLSYRLLHGTMSPEMRSAILPAFTAVSVNNPRARAQAAIYLVVTSSQFQTQR